LLLALESSWLGSALALQLLGVFVLAGSDLQAGFTGRVQVGVG
jgi:hypothetical protein